MKDDISLKIIAKIRTDFPSKFGIPRQSGLVPSLRARIVFEPEYRDVSAVRGLEGYSHLWLLWKFSESVCDTWQPTVRPPRLGGNKRIGVFATRSPFRPNPIGLSSVKLERIIENTPDGCVIEVSGADLMDNTPIYDIKPYIPYTDSHPDATGGFSDSVYGNNIAVDFPKEIENELPSEILTPLKEILANDPRPAYQNDDRVYSFEFADYKIKFNVQDEILKVICVEKI